MKDHVHLPLATGEETTTFFKGYSTDVSPSLKKGQGWAMIKALEVKLAEGPKQDRAGEGGSRQSHVSPVGAVGWGGEALHFPRGHPQLTRDSEHLPGDPAGPHSSDTKWASQRCADLVRRW